MNAPPHKSPGTQAHIPKKADEASAEEELDEVLARAAELAGDLAAKSDLAGADKSERDDDAHSERSDATGEVESDRLESLLGEGDHSTAAEETAGAAPTAPAEEANKAPTAADSATPNNAVPDFMKEFLSAEDTPAPDAASDAAASAHATARESKPGVVGTAVMDKAAGGETSSPAVPKPAEPETLQHDEDAVEASAPQEGSEDGEKTGGALGWAAPLVQRVSGPALPVVRKAVMALEVLDWPLHRAGGQVRQVTGWFAVATLATAAVVYLVSLF